MQVFLADGEFEKVSMFFSPAPAAMQGQSTLKI